LIERKIKNSFFKLVSKPRALEKEIPFSINFKEKVVAIRGFNISGSVG